MEAKQAIGQAKQLLGDLYAEEEVADIRLEEVEFDEPSDSWLITLGIMRPSIRKLGIMQDLSGSALKRTYKIVRIPNNGAAMPSVKMRELRIDE